jgi:DNA-binding NarL/FixJ family response regulator
MAIEYESPTARRLVGPGLLLIVVLVAGAFLEAAADEGGEAWFVRAFLIVVSTRNRPSDQRAGLDAGANAYLSKQSLEARELISLIRRVGGGS